MNNIAIITARGGSKRIPHKNIRKFFGKPIITYGIRAAIDSGLFSEVMISTDDEEIAEVAKGAGANVPFMRSAKNSDDFATTADVLEEVLKQYQQQGQDFDCACCIYPTAAFVTSEKLHQSFKILTENKYDSVVPVVQFGSSIFRSLRVDGGKLSLNFLEYENTRSQDLAPAYYDSGQFYWFRVNKFLTSHKLYTGNTGVVILDEMECQDIDTLNDWKLAEAKYKIMHG